MRLSLLVLVEEKDEIALIHSPLSLRKGLPEKRGYFKGRQTKREMLRVRYAIHQGAGPGTQERARGEV